MTLSLKQILEDIQNGTLLSADVVSKLDHDAILEARDSDPDFEANWKRVNDEILRLWSESAVERESMQLIEDIRRESFLVVSRATSQHEIASYVSDDFELITRAVVLGFNDRFINFLWESYSRKSVPMPECI